MKINRTVIQKIMLFGFIMELLFACEKNSYEKISKWEQQFATAKFEGSESCKSCHPNEFKDWENSHHDLSMQKADSSTVLGNFNNATFSSNGIQYKFFKKGKDFYVYTEGENKTYANFKILYTFGVTPLQQYMIAFPDGKLQCLLVAWDTKKKQWYHLQPDMKVHHPDWMHWTGGSMNWNNMCADCHSTNLKKNYHDASHSYETTYSIINVSCESCHGPQSFHVAYYKHPEKYKKLGPPPAFFDKKTTSKQVVDKCARCHSRRSQLTEYFDYNGNFLDHYSPSLLTYPTYHQDGQFNDENYEFASFTQSKMYHYGVSCRDCHNVHSLKLKKEGNALCLNCHLPKYDTYEHHYHQVNTEASQCINCHMTGKNYMGVDFRRDHSFRVPRPDQTVKYGTPNACNSCHKDKSAAWASDFIVEKYGNKRPQHFSDELLDGYAGNRNAFYTLLSNKNYPDIARATALNQWAVQPLSESEIDQVIKYLKDPSPLVRNEAVLAIGSVKNRDFSDVLKPLLMDSLRLVRISTYRYFSMNNKLVEENESSKIAQKDYEVFLKMNADFASGQHQIALQHQAKGNLDLAKLAYRKAIEIDDHYNSSRMNLALLEYQTGHVKEAEKLYLKIVEQEPDFSASYFMLGLLYNESGNISNTLKYLKLACEKEPKNNRAFYNYALKLQESGKYEPSIKVLDEALKYFKEEESLMYLKLIALIETKQNKKAIEICKNLILISPQNQNYQNILDNITK